MFDTERRKRGDTPQPMVRQNLQPREQRYSHQEDRAREEQYARRWASFLDGNPAYSE